MQGTLVPFPIANLSDKMRARSLPMKFTPKQNQAKYSFRAQLWKDFAAHYQIVLATSPEAFSSYCEAFRTKWVAGV
jgi:hypothetical protein